MADQEGALAWTRWASANTVKRIVLDFFAGTLPTTLRVKVWRQKAYKGYRFNVVFARRRRCTRG
jgi:hypothetical protein